MYSARRRRHLTERLRILGAFSQPQFVTPKWFGSGRFAQCPFENDDIRGLLYWVLEVSKVVAQRFRTSIARNGLGRNVVTFDESYPDGECPGGALAQPRISDTT
jgi:hypothetical protein